MQVAQRRHPMLRKSDRNGLLDAVRADIPSSIRPYPYGNFILAVVAAVNRNADSF